MAFKNKKNQKKSNGSLTKKSKDKPKATSWVCDFLFCVFDFQFIYFPCFSGKSKWLK